MVRQDAEVRETTLTVNMGEKQVLLDDCAVSLSRTEYQILVLLTNTPDCVFNRRQIIDASLGVASPSTDSAIDVHICNLRRKLGACGGRIETVRGKGFQFRRLPDDAPALCRC